MRKTRSQPPRAASLPPDRRSARALDLRAFTPSVLTLLAQKISATASAEYRPRFGVGVTDWRILAQLGAEPWMAPVDIAEAAGLDKAAVSRSLRDLREAGLVEMDGGPSQRRNLHALTPAGLALHDRLVEAARERERRLLAGFSADERGQLLALLERILKAVDAL